MKTFLKITAIILTVIFLAIVIILLVNQLTAIDGTDPMIKYNFQITINKSLVYCNWLTGCGIVK